MRPISLLTVGACALFAHAGFYVFLALAGKDLTWWNRGQLNAAETLAAKSERDVELALIKEQEDAMMLEALYARRLMFCRLLLL